MEDEEENVSRFWMALGDQKILEIERGSTGSVFLNRRAAARYRALASIIPGRERP